MPRSATLLALLVGSPMVATQQPAAVSCDVARELVLPSADELAAETIPWRTTLRDAALEADTADLPILLWAMNGHPLGCT